MTEVRPQKGGWATRLWNAGRYLTWKGCKYAIEHRYLSGWKPWPSRKKQVKYHKWYRANDAIEEFLLHAGPGYTRKEKRIVPVEKKTRKKKKQC